MIAELIFCILLVLGSIYELYTHNRKIEKLYPDQYDQQQSAQRRHLSLTYTTPGLLLVLLVIVLLQHIF